MTDRTPSPELDEILAANRQAREQAMEAEERFRDEILRDVLEPGAREHEQKEREAEIQRLESLGFTRQPQKPGDSEDSQSEEST